MTSYFPSLLGALYDLLTTHPIYEKLFKEYFKHEELRLVADRNHNGVPNGKTGRNNGVHNRNGLNEKCDWRIRLNYMLYFIRKTRIIMNVHAIHIAMDFNKDCMFLYGLAKDERRLCVRFSIHSMFTGLCDGLFVVFIFFCIISFIFCIHCNPKSLVHH